MNKKISLGKEISYLMTQWVRIIYNAAKLEIQDITLFEVEAILNNSPS